MRGAGWDAAAEAGRSRGPWGRASAPVRVALLLGVLTTLVPLGCMTPTGYVADADEEVGVVLDATTVNVLGERAEWVQQPEPAAPEPAAPPEGEDPADDTDLPTPDPESQEAQRIDLTTSLEAAFSTSREFINRREGLYLVGLDLTRTRFDFGPQLAAAVSTVWSRAEHGPRELDSTGTVSASQLLSTGGTLRMDGSLIHDLSGTGVLETESSSTAIDFSLTQPLARGAGYEVSHEALTQGEREMVYEVRSFELFRQDHVISIASDFFDLVSQRTQLANEERRYEEAVFDREKAEALQQVDRNQEEDVFLALRNEVNAESGLLAARADYEGAVETFRIRLGLPEGTEIRIADEEPPFQSVRLDADSAVMVALANRLDLITSRERLEDSERRVRISRDGLRPDVDLTLAYGKSRTHFGTDIHTPDTYSYSTGLAVDIPIQRTRERNSYRSAVISWDRAQRDHDLLLENVERDVRDALRQLDRAEQQIELQVTQITQQERAVAVTEIRYESGDAENRDLNEARQALIDAENALIDLKVSHFISRLRLYRNLGLLFIEENGVWRL